MSPIKAWISNLERRTRFSNNLPEVSSISNDWKFKHLKKNE